MIFVAMVLSSASGTVATSTTVPECPSVPGSATGADVELIHTPDGERWSSIPRGQIIGLEIIGSPDLRTVA